MNRALSNLKVLAGKIGATKGIRVASKSIRSPDLLKFFLQQLGDRGKGVMCFHPEEIKFLHHEGIDDILLAYPNYGGDTAKMLASHQKNLQPKQTMYLMVDLPEHLTALQQAAASCDVTFQVIVDIDIATAFPTIHFGVYRSSLRQVDAILKFVDEIASKPNLKLAGFMSYEAQIAGVADHDPRENGFMAAAKRQLKKRARKSVRKLRQDIAAALENRGLTGLPVLNGGGSGSVASTTSDQLINEVTIGSGILCPALFEYYAGLDLQPALAFAAPVVRRPYGHIATVYGGGYIASGGVGKNKQPKLMWPEGWDLSANEGAGEVQTPLIKSSKADYQFKLGDYAFFQPAKSGETMERFLEVLEADFSTNPPKILAHSYPTYRGKGVCFG